MKKVLRVLLTIIAMVAVMGIAIVVYRFKGYQDAVKYESERVARVDEVTVTTDDLKNEIAEISHLSVEEITAYIEEKAVIEELEEITDVIDGDANVEVVKYDPWSDVVSTGTVSGNSLISIGEEVLTDSEAIKEAETIDIEELRELAKELNLSSNVTDEDAEPSDDEDNEGDWEASDSRTNVSRVADLGFEAVKNFNSTDLEDEANSVTDRAKENHQLGDSVGGEDLTLKDRQALRSSYEETSLWIEADESVIKTSDLDFSDKKIACLGDSVTEAANLIDVPDYQQYTYPTRLKEILGCAKMTNLGIGGSSYGRYWADAFCDRYKEIPKDTDIIIVFGGYNDGYCLHEDMIGNMDTCEPQTLYGAVHDLMKGLREDYPDAQVIFMTPLPNLLHDVLRKERPELLPQTVIVDCIKEMAAKYDIDVIDAYNANFLDSHDADIVSEYIPDSVHPNEEGYQVLAEHVAAELIRLEENHADNKDTIDDDNKNTDDSKESKETSSPVDNIKKFFSRDSKKEGTEEETESSAEELKEDKKAKEDRGAADEDKSSEDGMSADKDEISEDEKVSDAPGDEENAEEEEKEEAPEFIKGELTEIIPRD